MVSKCANPNCLVPFLYLRKGTLFLFEVNSDLGTSDGDDSRATKHEGPHRFKTFWLCEHCSSSFMIRMIRGKVEIVRRGGTASGQSSHSRSELTEEGKAKSGQMSQRESKSSSDAGYGG